MSAAPPIRRSRASCARTSPSTCADVRLRSSAPDRSRSRSKMATREDAPLLVGPDQGASWRRSTEQPCSTGPPPQTGPEMPCAVARREACRRGILAARLFATDVDEDRDRSRTRARPARGVWRESQPGGFGAAAPTREKKGIAVTSCLLDSWAKGGARTLVLLSFLLSRGIALKRRKASMLPPRARMMLDVAVVAFLDPASLGERR